MVMQVSDFKPPPFAPRIWAENGHLILLFRDGQAIRTPANDLPALIRYLVREEARHRAIHPNEDWIARWSLAAQERGLEIRHAAERARDAEAIRAAETKYKRTKRKSAAAIKADKRAAAVALLASLGIRPAAPKHGTIDTFPNEEVMK
jgi:hypothetical protein